MRNYRLVSLLALLIAAAIVLLGDVPQLQAQPGRRRGGFPGGGGYGGGGRIDMGGGQPAAEKADDDKDKDKKDDDKDKDKKDDEKKSEEKKDEGPAPIQRPLMPDRPADPRELDIAPGDDGKISFSFKGQPWPSVLEWLADISDMSLQWEEAPAGYVDLTTRGRYTVDEVRNLLNSYLLSKGFTVLRNGELLIVVNLRKLDSSLLPRVTPSELDERGTYDVVRTFFDLDWLVAEQAAKEIESLVSTFGKVTPLKATNRLDVYDTAGNLRRIRELLSEEQSDAGQQRLVREFKLRFTRAEEVLDTLNTLLGIETKQAAGAVDPRQLMQAMMMAQGGGERGGGQGMAQLGKKENTVFLAVNVRENSILANAPPDKMGVIEQAIEAVDVPQGHGKGSFADAQRLKVYRLSGLQPETMVKVLKELGSLDPTAKLEIDAKKNALVVYAPLADHMLITDLVERLDGASRKFEVIQLRTLSAEYVAGSIITLMNGPEKPEENSRRRYGFPFFDSSQQQQDSSDKFWVEADVERNRLLLRANDVELAEVRALLVKLGEIPADQRYGTTTRVVPAMPGTEMKDALQKAQQLWQSVLPNPLEIEIDPSALEPARRRSKPDEDSGAGRRRAPTSAPAAAPTERPQRQQRGGRSAQRSTTNSRFRLAQDRVIPPSAVADDSLDPEETNDDEPKMGAQAGEGDKGTEPEVPSSEQPVKEPENNESENKAVESDAVADTPAKEADESKAPVAEGSDGADAEMKENSADDKKVGDQVNEIPSKSMRRRMLEEQGIPAADDESTANSADLPRRAHAPIRITLGPQGLLLSSSDTDALDRLEELLNNVMPPKTGYEFFTLKHTYAKDMVSLLKDIFKADMSKDSNSRNEVFDMFWNGYRGGASNQQARTSLSRRRPLNFVADPVTNTVLVQGADATQLAEIEDLIDRYDRAEPPNSESVRRTKRVSLRYAKAKEVADIVKDVYRDLLSPNDKALLGNQPQQQQQGRERNNNENFYSAMFSYLTDDPTKSEVVPRFKGMLSVGVDERSNGVVISAPQIILSEVLKMVADLDADAKPMRPVVRVLRVPSPGTAAQIQQAVNTKKVAAPAPDAASSPTNGSPSPAGASVMGGGGTKIRSSR
ncbi:MAG TPA: secretin N-terminal domain-containing protein [Pirellulales bacterium]|nr:secretin N-terminal domain-containing protein [Pirellulales bacterium]